MESGKGELGPSNYFLAKGVVRRHHLRARFLCIIMTRPDDKTKIMIGMPLRTEYTCRKLGDCSFMDWKNRAVNSRGILLLLLLLFSLT